jgi:hypothetical protein
LAIPLGEFFRPDAFKSLITKERHYFASHISVLAMSRTPSNPVVLNFLVGAELWPR